MNRRFSQRIFILIALLLLAGCATVTQKFKPVAKANVGIFADNTLAMLKEAKFGFTKNHTLYTKEFLNTKEPEEIEYKKESDDAEQVLRAMMVYSLKLVAIADTHGSTEARVEAYTQYLKGLDDEILEALELDPEYYKELIHQVGEQKNFMDALKKAQPIIDSLGRYMHQSLDNLEVAAEKLLNKVDKKVDIRYADLIRYQTTLEKGKYAILSAMEQLHLSGKGDLEAYNRLKTGQTIVPIAMIPNSPPTVEQRTKIKKHLIEKLDEMHRIGQEIEPDWRLYRESHLEIDRLYEQLLLEIRNIRLITLVWLRAHQKMASGIESPAEWFNINEAPGLLMKMGTKALF